MSRSLDRLIYMANQIATAFRTQEPGKAAAAACDHIWHFWDPRMRAMIVDHLQSGGEGLNEIARAAIGMLQSGDVPAPVTQATKFTEGGDPDLMSDG